MKYTLTKLENGVRVITVPMPSLESATLTVWVGTGSRYEDESVYGLSHFIEHMAFKGSSKYPTAKDVSEAIDAIGGEVNAATTKEWTNFYIKARAGKIETSFDILSDIVLRPVLDSNEIERERGVILEEMKMYDDTPMFKIGDEFENLVFKGSNLGRDIIGEDRTVKSVQKDDFLRYRKDHYYAENMIVTVAGGINEQEVISLAKKYFSEVVSGEHSKDKQFKSVQVSPEVFVNPKTKEQAHFMMGFVGAPKGSNTRFVEAVLATILGGGMSSRLFTEIREKRGLAYVVRTYSDHYSDTGCFVTHAGVDPKKIEEAIKVMLDQYYGIRDGKYPVSEEELTRAKEYLKGHLALALEDTKDVNNLFGEEELIINKVETPEEVFAGIDAVTVEDVYKFAKEIFKKEKLNLAVIGPVEKDRLTQLISI